jgi:hypothetical protein
LTKAEISRGSAETDVPEDVVSSILSVVSKKSTPEPEPETADDRNEDGISPADLEGEREGVAGEGSEESGGTTPSPSLSDDFELDVTVEGETRKVRLADLKSRYSGEGAIEKRLQEASRFRQAAEDEARKYYEALQEQDERLKRLDGVLTQVADSGRVDWDELRAKDPQRYLLERDKQRDAEHRRALVAQERRRIDEEQAELRAKALERYANDQAALLTEKLPDLRDPEKAPKVVEGLSRAASHYGFTPQEFAAVVDHRALLVLRDAAAYRQLLARKAAAGRTAQPVTPKPLLRPGANAAAGNKVQEAKAEKAILDTARRTGKPEDVARTLLTPARRRQ